jgi:hypothetical protein
MMSESNMMDGALNMAVPDAGLVHVPSEEIQHLESSTEWNFLRGTLFPERYPKAVPPSNAFDPITSPLSVKPTMNLALDKQVLSQASVPNTEGLILWLPKLAYNAFWHMGFVPRGTVIQMTGAPTLPTAIMPDLLDITYQDQCALPYGNSASKYIIKAPPDVARNFNKIRVYNGAIHLRSPTVSIGDVTLNGRVSAAVVSDTTDVAQVDGSAYPQSELVTSARQSKEIIENIDIQQGAVTVIGDDLRGDFIEPDQWPVSKSIGTMAVVDRGVANIALEGSAVNLPMAAVLNMFQWWVSPRNVTASFPTDIPLNVEWNTSQVYETYKNNVLVDQIGEADRLDFKIRMALQLSCPDVRCSEINININMLHVFQSISSGITGNVGTRIYSQNRSITKLLYGSTVSGNLYAGVNTDVVIDETFETTDAMLSNMSEQSEPNLQSPSGFKQDTGKYIGTSIRVIATFSSFDNIPQGSKQEINISASGEVLCKPHGGAELGHRGPAHILRYASLSAEQELILEGMVNMQAISKSTLNQLVKSGSMDQREPAVQQALNLCHSLYSNQEQMLWKSVWARNQYLAWLNKLQQMSYRDFAAGLLEQGDMSDTSVRSAAAAGFMRNNSQLITTRGNASGSLRARTVSGGQWNYGSNARGQFMQGRSGGQFQSNAGGFLGDLLHGAGDVADIVSHFA